MKAACPRLHAADGQGAAEQAASSPVLAPPHAGLAQNRYFEDGAFLEYLKYLQYWQQPQYARFVM